MSGLKFVPQNPPKIGNQTVKILERSEIRGGSPFHCRLKQFDCAVRNAENGFYYFFFFLKKMKGLMSLLEDEGIHEFVGRRNEEKKVEWRELRTV